MNIVFTFISCFLSFLIGFFIGVRKPKTKAIESEYLIDADVNRMIGETNKKSKRAKILSRLDKHINDEAKKGKTWTTIPDGLNDEINKYFTANDIREHFKNTGYHVKFLYEDLGYSEIYRVSW